MSTPFSIATHQVVGSSFGFFTAEEVRQLSVKRIHNPVSLSKLLTPIDGGLYDLSLGPIDKDAKCVTCGLMDLHCPGHFGHIELPVPIYNPLIFAELLMIMKLICFNCHHFRMETDKTRKYVKILKLIDKGDLEKVLEEVDKLSEKANRRKAGEAGMERGDATDIDDMAIDSEDVLRLKNASNLTDFRNSVIHKFTHEMPTLACGNCAAPRLPIAREGHTKLFMKRHGPTKMRSCWEKGARYRSVLHDGGISQTGNWSHESHVKSLVDPNINQVLNSSIEQDPIVNWLFYKDEMNTAAYKKQVAIEAYTAGTKKQNQSKPSDGKNSKNTVIEKPIEIQDMGDKELAAATAKSLPSNQRIMFPNEVMEHLRRLWIQEEEIVSLVWSTLFKSGLEGRKHRRSSFLQFFIQVLPVPPNRFRPIGAVNGIKSEHTQNILLTRVLAASRDLVDVLKGVPPVLPPSTSKSSKSSAAEQAMAKIKEQQSTIKGKSELWIEIQNAVNDLTDNTLTNKLKNGPAKPPGIKQIIEKKQGLFRQNMMGKRVDFAARSVISPDPFIHTTEIGVPLYFAKGLNYPEPVTDYNVEYLRQLVLNGPDVHPGANAVEYENGNVVPIRGGADPRFRIGIANTLQKPSLSGFSSGSSMDSSIFGVKKVYRHLMNGDFLIVNRQPTLHKPSMMVHKARVLGKENTIQMHYCNCNTYNADFDGDEMNLHLVQNEVARAEAHSIALNDNQYIVPKDGSPIRGLIQDHILSGVLLTQRDTFLNRDQFNQLLYFCIYDAHPSIPMISFPPPAILKPKPLWTGKQVITALLENLLVGFEPLNLASSCTVPEEMWGKGSNEGIVIIRQNMMLTGSLGKNQFGAKPHGLVHSVYELYGPSFAARLLTTIGRLLTHWLQFVGFTCGIDDALLNSKTENERKELRLENDKSGLLRAGIFLGLFKQEELPEGFNESHITQVQKDYIYQKLQQASESKEEWDKWDKFMIAHASKTSTKIIDLCLPKGQIKPFPKNNLALMTVSGAKGGRVNFSQISCLLGQQELEGKRVPLLVTGRSLPCFLPFDPQPRAGGYITDRFLTGVRPQEYFFHCMAGREGLIDTAVKTSRSGYLQRCIVKHLESMVVQYDHTVRDSSDGSVIQFRYGEDSIDVTKSGYMKKFEFFADNLDALLSLYDFESAKDKLKIIPSKESRKIRKQLDEEKRRIETTVKNLEETSKQLGLGIEKLPIVVHSSTSDNSAEYDEDGSSVTRVNAAGKTVNIQDPLMSTYWPGSALGCISEQYDAALELFIMKNPSLFEEGKKSSKKEKSGKHTSVESTSNEIKIPNDFGKKKIDSNMFRMAMHLKYLRSLAEAGEAVGVLAAQSIGEPSTQMTLNTFHLAGKGEVNVTLGIPRLRELIQTAGSIKTPSMTLPMRKNFNESDAHRLANRLYLLKMNELIERIQVTETLKSNGNNHSRQYEVEMEISPFESKWELTWNKLKNKTVGFVASLLNEVAKSFKIKRFFAGRDTMGFHWDALADVIDDNDPIEEDEDGDNNHTDDGERSINNKKRKKDEEDDSDEDMDIQGKDEDSSSSSEDEADDSSSEEGKDDDESEDDKKSSSSSDDSDNEEIETDDLKSKSKIIMDVDKPNRAKSNDMDVDQQENTSIPSSATKSSSKQHKLDEDSAELLKRLKSQSPYLVDYNFDQKKRKVFFTLSIPADKPKILLVSMIERHAEKFVIREVSGIVKAAVLVPDTKNPTLRVQTAGINFEHVHRLSRMVDVDNVTTNDVQAVFKTYGIEAAREALKSEISSVFKAYGIGVDPRHLTLVADYMTHTGEIRAMTRGGMASASSPFLKMSFESTTRFLASSSARGDYENMLGPSASIVLGLAPKVGSGLCELRHNLAFKSDQVHEHFEYQ